MRHSLQSHIAYLESLIQNIEERRGRTGLSAQEVEDLELQLAQAEGALDHYRQAYLLELSVSGSEPPNGPSTNSGEGTESGAERTRSRNRGGSGNGARARRIRTAVGRGAPGYGRVFAG